MSTSKLLLSLLVLALVAAPWAWSEEALSPKTAFSTRVATLPAPSAKHAFKLELDLVSGGQTLGQATLSAKPLDEGETLGEAGLEGFWEIRETMVFGGGAFRREAVTVLDRHLSPQRGAAKGVTPQAGPFELTWLRTREGFLLNITTEEDGGAKTTREEKLTRGGPFLSTITALWLFCRLNVDQPGSFEATLFDATPGPKEKNFETGTWTIPEPTTWNEVKAVVVTGTKSDGTRLEAGFDVETGAFLGARFSGNTPAPLEFRVRKAEEATFVHAKTAREAANQAALGFATGDLDLLENVIDWPTVHAGLKAGHDAKMAGVENAEPFPPVDALKAQILESWKASLPKNPAPMIQMALKMAAPGVTEEERESYTRVQFPEIFRSMALDVAEFEGVWRLVRLPQGGKK